MKKKYIQLERSDVAGSYIQSLDTLAGAILAELDDLEYLKPNTQIILTVVEMEEGEYEQLDEFMGW